MDPRRKGVAARRPRRGGRVGRHGARGRLRPQGAERPRPGRLVRRRRRPGGRSFDAVLQPRRHDPAAGLPGEPQRQPDPAQRQSRQRNRQHQHAGRPTADWRHGRQQRHLAGPARQLLRDRRDRARLACRPRGQLPVRADHEIRHRIGGAELRAHQLPAHLQHHPERRLAAAAGAVGLGRAADPDRRRASVERGRFRHHRRRPAHPRFRPRPEQRHCHAEGRRYRGGLAGRPALRAGEGHEARPRLPLGDLPHPHRLGQFPGRAAAVPGGAELPGRRRPGQARNPRHLFGRPRPGPRRLHPAGTDRLHDVVAVPEPAGDLADRVVAHRRALAQQRHALDRRRLAGGAGMDAAHRFRLRPDAGPERRAKPDHPRCQPLLAVDRRDLEADAHAGDISRVHAHLRGTRRRSIWSMPDRARRTSCAAT